MVSNLIASVSKSLTLKKLINKDIKQEIFCIFPSILIINIKKEIGGVLIKLINYLSRVQS